MKDIFNKFILSLIIVLLATIGYSCKKEPGQGGTSTIKGKVYVKDYDANFQTVHDQYYGPDVDVYIIYGDGTTYDDDYKTSYDGSYEFDFLQEGTYKVFAYSKDSSGAPNVN